MKKQRFEISQPYLYVQDTFLPLESELVEVVEGIHSIYE
jgi:hypothetical protein